MIRAILFDADGVLQTAPHTRDRVRSLSPDSEQTDRFMSEVFRAEGTCMTGQNDFPQLLQIVLDKWDVRTPLDQVLAIWEAIELIPEVMSVVSDARDKGVRCYLATNQQLHRANYMRATFNFDSLFDGAFYSCEMGVAKPDERYFQEVISELAVPSSEVLFIDDKAANVVAAQTCGLKALQFDATAIDSPGEALRTALSGFGVE